MLWIKNETKTDIWYICLHVAHFLINLSSKTGERMNIFGPWGRMTT